MRRIELIQDLNDLPALLLRHREALGVSQRELAKTIGVHQSTVSQVERSVQGLTWFSAQRHCAGLDIDIGLLVSYEEVLRRAG